jgi:hypothetical protein
MWRCTGVPRNVYDFLSPCKPLCRCAQARHFVIGCWLVVAIMRDPGVGTLQGALPSMPAGLSSWALRRMVRSGQWDAQAVLSGMSQKVLRTLPPPADGRLDLSGDTTHKTKRGRQPPLGHVPRQRESSP